jgi:choice-of-anchor B domain-containing protein
MKMIALVVLALVACCGAATVERCTVGEWSQWSECVSSKHCPQRPHPLLSYSMKASTEWDSGRDAMQRVMIEKTKQWEENARCIAEGTCADLMMKPIAGEYKCDATGIAGDIPCSKVDQRSFLDFRQLGWDGSVTGDANPKGNDVWGWIDPDNNDEYAIMGLTGGTAFVRITDPANPVPLGFIKSATVASSWRDIKVIGNYAYIVSEARDHGLQVFDLTHLRGKTAADFQYYTPDAVNKNFGQAHNIVANVDTNFVYVVGSTASGYPNTCRGGLHVFDVSDPLNPRDAGCYGGDAYVHDAQCVVYQGPDTRYYGKELCFCFNEDSLTIVDVDDKSRMTMIAKTGYINVAYTHQGWLTEDHELLLLDDELDEQDAGTNDYTKTYVWDVRDLTNPQLKSVFESSERSIDHNQYIIGDYTFQGNYESGLRILHINRQTSSLSQVAYFDVHPSRTTANFNGAWSVFPYYPSGNIAVSSINYGLFIVKPDWASINALVNSQQTYAESTRVRELVSAQEGASCPALVQSVPCQAPVDC